MSPATATTDLAAAVASGLLRAEGQRRGRRYRAGAALYQRVGTALGFDASGPDDAARATITAALASRFTRDQH